MDEIVFTVKPEPEGGFSASCRLSGGFIATEGDTWEHMEAMVRDAVECHFGKGDDKPKRIRLHLEEDRILQPAA
jgi:hypothetical protein